MKKADRIQEWLADHISWVQYQNIRPADRITQQASGLRFKYQMPLGKRIDLIFFSLVLLVIGIMALAAASFVIYAVLF